MSFLSNAFSGASNNFSPGAGSDAQKEYTHMAQGNYSNAQLGLNSLAEQLKQQAAGQGPNLANQQLQNATGQNVSNQAALMAGQRGASSNVGLMGRQIANQGANIQQQAAGQSAENVLKQQMMAQSQLQNVYGTQGQLANQNYATTQGQVTANNQMGMEQAGQNAAANRGLIGGVASAGAKLLGLAEGGQIPQPTAYGTEGGWGFNFVSGVKPKDPMAGATDITPKKMQAPQQVPVMMAAHGGMLPFTPHDYRQGGTVQAQSPQQHAMVSGNSYKNDKIPGMLSEGEVVLPREITMSPNAPRLAADFMSQVMQGKHKAKKR